MQLTSAYNAFVDADACCIANMANAALFALYPLADRYVQRPPPSQQALINAGYMTSTGSVVGSRLYYMNYFGDFDSAVRGRHAMWAQLLHGMLLVVDARGIACVAATWPLQAWLYSQMPPFWSDPARGSIPLGWGVDPELALRFPPLFDIMVPGATPKDIIISGDSGAGYINPTLLYGPGASLQCVVVPCARVASCVTPTPVAPACSSASGLRAARRQCDMAGVPNGLVPAVRHDLYWVRDLRRRPANGPGSRSAVLSLQPKRRD